MEKFFHFMGKCTDLPKLHTKQASFIVDVVQLSPSFIHQFPQILSSEVAPK